MVSPYASASELATRIRRNDLSPVAVVETTLERIAERNDATNAFVTLIEEEARERAREAERCVERGESLGPLHGVPIAIKDLFELKAGMRNTFGSKAFADNVPEETSLPVERLEGGGGIVVGKTNTSEFGGLPTTDNLLFGPTSSPFDPAMNAGGSSGGSAAAVADGLVPIAQGSDAGGSIRIPAACCGVYGLKPSFGRIPLVRRPDAFNAQAPFVGVGPMARTVEDAALALEAMAGHHPRDPFSAPRPDEDFVAAVREGIDGARVAYAPDFDGLFAVDERVRDVVDDAVGAFEKAGATVETRPVDLGLDGETFDESFGTLFRVLHASALEAYERRGIDLLADHGEDLSAPAREAFEAVAGTTVREYKRADVARTTVLDSIREVFETFDLLVTPTLGVPWIGNVEDGLTTGPTEDGEEIETRWNLTGVFNRTGHPAASIPAGFVEGHPIGLQIVGPRWEDATVLAASGAFERVRPWGDAYPPR